MIKIERYNLESIASKYSSYLKTIGYRTENKIYISFLENLDEYIVAPLAKFKTLKEEFETHFADYISEYESKTDNKKETEYGKFISYMEGRFNTVMQFEIEKEITMGSWLAQELEVNTCPYCNRQYTFTINKKKKIRPQFDHFYPKSTYPYFALSFYNLIPCCPICNHTKRDSNKEMIHPYCEGFGDSFYFNINHKDYVLNNDKIRVKFNFIKNCNPKFIEKCENNITEFALEDLYSKHVDYIEEIIEKAYSYNESFYDSLIYDFSKIGKTSSEINRLIFGNYIELADNEKRPLSKLTRDLLNDIGLNGT
jgi:hypothetical protein